MARRKNKWAALPPLRPGTGGSGGGVVPGDIEQTLINHINNTTMHPTVDLIEKLSTKDVVFKMSKPIEIGIQVDTEFLYPYNGIIEAINVSLPVNNKITSNIIMSIQIFRSNGWRDLDTTTLQVTDSIINKVTSYPINNERLRIVIIDGDVDAIDGLNVILKIKDK